MTTVPFYERPAWTKIQIGTYGSIEELGLALVNKRGSQYLSSDYNVLRLICLTSKPQEIELYTATVAELGFNNTTKLQQIQAKLKEWWFGNCPDEVGPQLYLQYANELREKDSFHIIMDPIYPYASCWMITFGVNRRNLYFDRAHNGYANADIRLNSNDRIVFCRK